MPSVIEELKTCLDELSLEYEIEEVNYIPQAEKKIETQLPVWRLLIQAEINGLSTNVDLFLVFPKGFGSKSCLIYRLKTEKCASMRMVSPTALRIYEV